MTLLYVCLAALCAVVVYGYCRYRFATRVKGELAPLLPSETRLSWRVPRKRTVTLDTQQLSPAEVVHRAAEGSAKPIDLPDHTIDAYQPEDAKWMAALTVSAAATDGFIQASPHFAEFGDLKLDTLKHVGAKIVEGLGKTESLHATIGNHIILAAEHSHEAWLAAAGAFLAKHLALTSIDHAVAAHNALAGLSEHGSAVAAAHHSMLENFLYSHSSVDHAGLLADIHFPFITVLFSGYREFSLLVDEKTTFYRALQNVVVDGAGVAVGGLAGVKAGAFIGLSFGPAGSVIGAAVGGIVGAVGGKLGATAIRFSGFKSAKNDYISTADTARRDVEWLIQQSRYTVELLRQEVTRDFDQTRAQVIAAAQCRVAAQAAICETRLEKFATSFLERLDELARQLDVERKQIVETVPATPFRLIWPARADVMRGMINKWFQRAARSISTERDRYRRLSRAGLGVRIEEIRRFLRQYQFELDQLDKDMLDVISTFDQANLQAREIEKYASRQIESLRDTLTHKFAAGLAAVTRTITEETTKRKEQIAELWNKLKKEADAVGISLSPLPGTEGA